jgi:hypothetical protein
VVWIRRRGLKAFRLGMRFVNISRSLQAAVESLGKFGYIDLEAAAKARQQKFGDPYRAAQGRAINASANLPDYYGILGISHEAAAQDIKRAYHTLARKHHPDVARTEADAATFLRITEAYEVLNDAAKRKSYDLRRAG